MSSAIVLVVIAGAWAFVLVPMVRQRHETSSELRSVDRFARTMRVLSRRRVPVTRSRVVTPRPPSRPVVSTGRVFSDRELRAQERRILLWRRRVTALTLLVFVVLAVAGLAVRGRVGLGLLGVALVAVLGTGVWLRRSARTPRAAAVFRASPAAAAAPAAPSAMSAATAGLLLRRRRPVPSSEPLVAERVPARLRPERRVVARTVVVEETFVDHEPTWGVRVLDLNAPVRDAADPGDELFDQTRLTG